MDKRYYLTCLWPGLPELWFRGRLSALPIAIAFAAALNAVLIARYLFPGWFPAPLVSMAFWIGGALWAVCAWQASRELPVLLAPRVVSDEPDRFEEAHAAYLAGEWANAEKLLQEVLAIEARDPPALLFLTAIYRITGRHESAELLIEEIERLEVADRWFLEVEAEKKRLHRDQSSLSETENSDSEASSSNHTSEEVSSAAA